MKTGMPSGHECPKNAVVRGVEKFRHMPNFSRGEKCINAHLACVLERTIYIMLSTEKGRFHPRPAPLNMAKSSEFIERLFNGYGDYGRADTGDFLAHLLHQELMPVGSVGEFFIGSGRNQFK